MNLSQLIISKSCKTTSRRILKLGAFLLIKSSSSNSSKPPLCSLHLRSDGIKAGLNHSFELDLIRTCWLLPLGLVHFSMLMKRRRLIFLRHYHMQTGFGYENQACDGPFMRLT
jgi:hypothetical protein